MGKRIDENGNRYGRLTAIEPDVTKPGYWFCKCDCGKVKSVRGAHLRAKATSSCGCLRDVDETGNRYGRWTVVDLDVSNNRKGVYWNCLCDCGDTGSIRGSLLREGTTKSCGCLRKEIMAKRQTTHGRSRSSIYKAFDSMHQRCLNETSKSFPDYGGRGITICNRWNRDTPHAFENFVIDMGEKPSPSYTLERIDNEGPYHPGNCRWATMQEQSDNKRSNVNITVGVRTQNITQWSDELGIDRFLVYSRLQRGWTNEQALGLEIR